MRKDPALALVRELAAWCQWLTPAQRTWLEVLGQCPGVEAYCWRPADWEAIAARLQRAP